MSPTKRTRIEFNSIEDVYSELSRGYNEITEIHERQYSIGSALFTECKMYCNPSIFINDQDQMFIKKYNYSKMSGTPPYQSINQTPAIFVDAFQIIEEECQQKPIK
jgi:hypothetical protein